jgi:dynein heavy chain 1, cytosolic
VDRLEAGEKLLARQRYTFPADWPYASQLAAAHSDVQQVLARRAKGVEDRLPGLQSRVRTEATAAAARATAAVSAWTVERPLGTGGVSPVKALATMARHQSALAKVRAEQQRLAAARDALGLEAAADGESLRAAEQEAAELKEVWSALAGALEQVLCATVLSNGFLQRL